MITISSLETIDILSSNSGILNNILILILPNELHTSVVSIISPYLFIEHDISYFIPQPFQRIYWNRSLLLIRQVIRIFIQFQLCPYNTITYCYLHPFRQLNRNNRLFSKYFWITQSIHHSLYPVYKWCIESICILSWPYYVEVPNISVKQ